MLIHKNPKKLGMFKFRTYYDEKGMKRELKDNNGDIVPAYEVTSPALSLDIDKDVHKRIYDFLKDHPIIKSGKYWAVVDRKKAEETKSEQALKSSSAIIEATKMNIKEIRDFGRLIGLPMTSGDDVLRARIINYANSQPEKFMEIYTDVDKDYRIFIAKALNKRILVKDRDAYTYNTQRIGLSETQVILWLKDNLDIMALLKDQLRRSEGDALQETTNNYKKEIIKDVEFVEEVEEVGVIEKKVTKLKKKK